MFCLESAPLFFVWIKLKSFNHAGLLEKFFFGRTPVGSLSVSHPSFEGSLWVIDLVTPQGPK